MRPVRAILLVFCAVAACQNDDGGVVSRVDSSQNFSSAGEVSLTDGGSLQYSITSDRYKQWLTAQEGLDRRIATRFGALLQPASPSERSIDRAVQFLQSEPGARAALARAKMSAREFVVMTVALEQEMRVASESGSRPDTMPLPTTYPYPYPTDTSSATPYPSPYPTPYPTPYPPSYPYPVVPPTSPYPTTVLPPPRVDSTRRVDTVFIAPTPARDTSIPRRDTLFPQRDSVLIRRDTIVPRRDTVLPKRDTVLAKRDTVLPKRDTAAPRRDTLLPPTPRRDSLGRDTLAARTPR